MISTEHATIHAGGKTLEVARHTSHEHSDTIVLLHEALGSVKHWRDFPERLAAATHCNVLLYSRAGHGHSDGPVEPKGLDYLQRQATVVLKCVLERWQIHRPILFGHSEGALIALVFAASFPDLPRAMIVESAIIDVEPVTAAGMRNAKAAYQHSDLREKLKRYHRNPDAVFDAFSGPWPERTTPELLAPFLNRIQCPTLVLQGDRDEYGSPKQRELLLQHIPQAQGTLIPSCGHTPHREHPHLVLAEVRNFLLHASILK